MYRFLFGCISILFLHAEVSNAAFMPGDAWSGGILRYKLVYNTGDPAVDLSLQAKSNFEIAADYYNNNTQIRLIDATNDPLITDRSSYVRVYRQTPPNRSYSNGHCGIFCGQPYIKLTDDADVGVAVHEILHTLAFAHEQQRHNRSQYVELSPNIPSDLSSDYSIMDYPFYTELDFGNFDYNSILIYNQYMHRKATVEETLEVAKEIVSHERRFRILLEDSTPSNSFDNAAINNEVSDSSSFAVSTFEDQWWSAYFDFEYVGTGNRFRLKHIRSQNYLSESSSVISLLTKQQAISAGSVAQWDLVVDGAGFKIKNASTGKFLHNNSGNLTLNSSSSSRWLVKIRNTKDLNSDELSIMDKVGLHYWYGYPFRFRVVDSSPENLNNNPALHVQYGSLEIQSTPVDLTWHSAMWVLERVPGPGTASRYIRIKNLWTSEYLNLEEGALDLDPVGTLNGSGVALHDWWSAQWDLVIKNDYFLIKNRWTSEYLYKNDGVLGKGTNPDASYRWSLQEVDWTP